MIKRITLIVLLCLLCTSSALNVKVLHHYRLDNDRHWVPWEFKDFNIYNCVDGNEYYS